MLADAIGNYLDTLEEREFDAPFMALLRAMGFTDIHFLHGAFEFGKDFIAKHGQGDGPAQFAFQTKAGNINLTDWSGCRGQIDLLRTDALAHPSFNTGLPRNVVLVTTGRLIGGAPLAAQQYAEHLKKLGEIGFEIWDRERLIELMSSTPEVGLAGAVPDALMSLLGHLGEVDMNDADIEQYSRRWQAGDEALLRGTLEAAIIANQLRREQRLDLAAYVALCLIRAAWACGHGFEPPRHSSVTASDTGRAMFKQYSTDLFNRCSDDVLGSRKLILDHQEPGAYVTYPVRCAKVIELLGLLGLMVNDSDDGIYEGVPKFLNAFCLAQPGAGHPISDHWAISLVPPVLLLWRNGYQVTVRSLLENVIRWIGDRYESDHIGLAEPQASPIEEIAYLLGNPFEHVRVDRRSQSYVSAVVLDLAAALELKDTYEVARNDFLAVNALPVITEVSDSTAQFLFSSRHIRWEPNMPYKDTWEPQQSWKVAPHHLREPDSLYLEKIGRAWDQLAISSVLRDRHFASLWHRLSASTKERL